MALPPNGPITVAPVGDAGVIAHGENFLSNITPVEVSAWYASLKAKRPGAAPAAYRLLGAILNTLRHGEVLGLQRRDVDLETEEDQDHQELR